MGPILVLLVLLSLLGPGSANYNPCLDFDPENCTLTFAPDTSRICGVLIKGGWECRSVKLKNNNKTWEHTLYPPTWEPGVPECNTVSVRGPDGSIRISNNTFIFSTRCDLAMFMSKQYSLWPPRRRNNIVTFSIAYCLCACLLNALLGVCIHLLVTTRIKNANNKEKMP
uniref:Early E3 18.5 kDa glycoprotein n=1 Tax=Human adenovirus 14 TaxID=10521 RepID=Q91PL1_9ADEN|nr:putative gp18.7 kDa protein [Human adenovirus 14]